jgi:cytochrome P450
VVRVAPNWIIVSDPAEIRRIWSVHSGYHRGPWYKGFRVDPSTDSIVTAMDNNQHQFLRGGILKAYQSRNAAAQEQVVDEQITKFLDLLDTKYTSSHSAGLRPFDMAHGMQFLTHDMMSAIEFSTPFGYLDTDADPHGIISTLEKTILPCCLMALLPPLLSLVSSPLLKPLLPKPTDRSGLGYLLGRIEAHVGARYSRADPDTPNPDARRGDFLQAFVDSPLTRAQVSAEALVHFFAGADTVAICLRTAVFLLASTPAAYRRLQEEIDRSAAATAAAAHRDRPAVVADAEVRALPYLQACVKEALRLWPPIMSLMGKVSDVGDDVCGVRVPAGTSVGIGWFGVMRDERVFGRDADAFEPVRWLEADGEALARMEATQGLAFAAGTRWECLGKRIAMMEVGKCLFEVSARIVVREWLSWGMSGGLLTLVW